MTGTPVTLIDGSASDTWSPAWQAECLQRYHDAQHVLRLADKETRNWWMDNEYCARISQQLNRAGVVDVEAGCALALERLRAETLNLHRRRLVAQAARMAEQEQDA